MIANHRTGAVSTGGAILLATASLIWIEANRGWMPLVTAQVPPPGAPIHGYVGAFVFGDRQPGGNSFPTGLINVPDIAVVAKDIKTGTTSSPTKTNPQGYFRTPSLAPGEYQICVSR